MHLGEVFHLPPGSVGAVCSVRTLSPGGPRFAGQSDIKKKTTLAAARSPALESSPPVPTIVSQSALAWVFHGGGVAYLHSLGVPRGRRVLAVMSPPWLLMSQGEC